jgi:hypothetical protein
MYLINRLQNQVSPLPHQTFASLGFNERYHLQEWITKSPTILGEDLLIIQKEFSGFSETNERLDLLALDKKGNLVIIENKLDDTGRDVVWQALKYVSYCSGITKEGVRQIFEQYLYDEQLDERSAETILCEFLEQEDFTEITLNQGDQRIILVSANYRKEVTSTVMWLRDHGIDIKCIKIAPFTHADDIFVDAEQIIPIKEAEEFLITIGNKQRQERVVAKENQYRHEVRVKFWKQVLKKMNEQTHLFQNISPKKDNWLNCGSGISGIEYTISVTARQAKVYLLINAGTAEYNKQIFDNLYQRRAQIESKMGHPLLWERKDNGKESHIACYYEGVSVFNEEDWASMIDFLVENIIKLEFSLCDELKSAVTQ